MATVLTEPASQDEMVHVSIPILKWEQDEDGDLVVKGIATDGTVDSDSQIVDAEWSAKALGDWIATGGNVRQSHDPHRPVGKGLSVDVDKDGSGQHWVTSVIVDPAAQRLVKKGVLTAYSVGISRPVIKHDPTGRARGGIIIGGELAELSIVDRPSNKSSYLELAKSAANGDCEFISKMHIPDEAIVEAAEKSAAVADISSFDADDALFSFTPKDMANMIKDKIIKQHYKELAGDAAPEDVIKAVTEEVAPAPEVIKDTTAKPETIGEEGDSAAAIAGKVISSPETLDADGDRDDDGIAGKAAPMPKKGKKGKKMPPWLNKPADGDDCKMDHTHTDKCHTTPKEAGNVEEAADMQPAPVGELMESPAKDFMKSETTESVALRYKTVGIDFDLGVLHDLTCPAFNPGEVTKFHPMADLTTVIDVELWQRKALVAATGGSIEDAILAQKAWQAAACVKAADQNDLNLFRLEMHKAFRDANPGVSAFPTPGALSPKQFCRPVITDGHAQNSSGYGMPNSSAMVATSPASAGNFNRPPLSSGQQTPSPSFMKNDFPYPQQPGVPSRIDYPEIEKEKARQALSMLHDHLNHMFPSACPITDQDAYRQEQPIAAPNPVGKSEEAPVKKDSLDGMADVYSYIGKLEKKVRKGKITGDQARELLAKHMAGQYATELRDQVTKGMSSINEVRKALGLEETEPVSAAPVVPEPVVEKGINPDLIKSMMAEALVPLNDTITALSTKNAEYQEMLAAQKAEYEASMGEQNKRWEALANSADPSTASFAGLALRKTASPAGNANKSEASDGVRGMMMRQLERTWRTSENPAEREAAYAALNKMK